MGGWGGFCFYNRSQHTWTEVKDILIHTFKESPNKLTIASYADTSIKIQWRNNTTDTASIVVERKTAGGIFAPLATVASTESALIDTTTAMGSFIIIA